MQDVSVQIKVVCESRLLDVMFVDPWEQNTRCLRSRKRCFRGNIQFVRVEEQSKVHLRGDDGMVYHHLTPTCGFKKWRISEDTRERGRSKRHKME